MDNGMSDIKDTKKGTIGDALRKATKVTEEMRAKEKKANRKNVLDALNKELHTFADLLEETLAQKLDAIETRGFNDYRMPWSFYTSQYLNIDEVKNLCGYQELNEKANGLGVELSAFTYDTDEDRKTAQVTGFITWA